MERTKWRDWSRRRRSCLRDHRAPESCTEARANVERDDAAHEALIVERQGAVESRHAEDEKGCSEEDRSLDVRA